MKHIKTQLGILLLVFLTLTSCSKEDNIELNTINEPTIDLQFSYISDDIGYFNSYGISNNKKYKIYEFNRDFKINENINLYIELFSLINSSIENYTIIYKEFIRFKENGLINEGNSSEISVLTNNSIFDMSNIFEETGNLNSLNITAKKAGKYYISFAFKENANSFVNIDFYITVSE